MKKKISILLATLTVLFLIVALLYNQAMAYTSFSTSKRLLEDHVYHDHRQTIYCDIKYNESKVLDESAGFSTTKYLNRSTKIEWEHVVPAENFGRNFIEWREGHQLCHSSAGSPYKGRRCATKANEEYKRMQADMFNLYPAVGSVNAVRRNYNFGLLPEEQPTFGGCGIIIQDKTVDPPIRARGKIARTYLYMDINYPKFTMSSSQRQLMNAWDKQYPISEWECLRAKRITDIQKTENIILKNRCEH